MPGDPLRLDGKVAVVTGAAQRIGREIATVFAEQGASAVIADIQDARGQEVVAAIRAGGGSAAYIHADVARHEEVRSLVDQTVASSMPPRRWRASRCASSGRRTRPSCSAALPRQDP